MEYKIRESYLGKSVVFDVHTQRGIFEMTNRRDWSIDESDIVWIDSTKFVDLWRNTKYVSHQKVANGNPETWIHDSKYRHAESGFLASQSVEDNPVPLAWISCSEDIESIPVYKKKWLLFREIDSYLERKMASVSFTDGITRTIWLITNGCTQFPVQCRMGQSALLHQYAGIAEIQPMRVADYFEAEL